MRRDIDLLANEYILLKRGSEERLVDAVVESEKEIARQRPFHSLEKFILCKQTAAGDAVKYAARAVFYAQVLIVNGPLKEALWEEKLMKAAASLAKQLQALIQIRLSTLPLRAELESELGKYDGEGLPVRLLNSLIVLEAVLLLQLHVATRGRFTEPDELCAYCFALFAERDLLDALRMPKSVHLSDKHYAQLVESIRELGKDKDVKRIVKVMEGEGPIHGFNDLLPLILIVLLIILMYILTLQVE